MRSLPALLWQFFREMHSSENRVAHLPTKCTIFLGEKAPRLASLKIEIAFSQLSRILDIAPRADSKENRAFRHFLCQAVSPSVHFGMFCAKQCLRLLAPPAFRQASAYASARNVRRLYAFRVHQA